MSRIALFIPCYVDQFYPRAAIAAVQVLERLGVNVVVKENAVCCGQPPANAGFASAGDKALASFVDAHAGESVVVVLSGSCALHVKAHAEHAAHSQAAGAAVARNTTEFCAFLHDVVGLERVAALGATFAHRVAVHVGCHALRGLGLATPSETPGPRMNKVHALLQQVRGLEIAPLSRADECCGFGGTFAVSEEAISVKMGRDRLRDFTTAGAEAVVSPDLSCLMHLAGLDQHVRTRAGAPLPMMHVAEVLAGGATLRNGSAN